MRTLIASLATALGLACLAAGPANAGTIPAAPKAHFTIAANGALDQVHWRYHRRHYAYYPRYRYYDDYYSYPRYRSYGYYGGLPGFGLYIGPRHWRHHRNWW